MTLPELMEQVIHPSSSFAYADIFIFVQFDLASLTHRRNSLDIAKLNYLNKHHLMLKWATPDGLEALARRIRPMIKEAFPTSQYTSIQDIMKFILALEVRLASLLRSDVIWLIIELQSRFTTVDDIPYMGPFFFLDPDLSSEEARSMAKSFANSDHGKLFFSPSSSPAYEPSFLPPVQTLERVSAKLEEQHEDWDDLDISSLIHTVRADLNINQKTFMSILRYALTGMKVR